MLPHEHGLTLLRCRMKKHRWFPRLLKTHDPLVFSLGWRRFQSLPMFNIQDMNERFRFLKYAASIGWRSLGRPFCYRPLV